MYLKVCLSVSGLLYLVYLRVQRELDIPTLTGSDLKRLRSQHIPELDSTSVCLQSLTNHSTDLTPQSEERRKLVIFLHFNTPKFILI